MSEFSDKILNLRKLYKVTQKQVAIGTDISERLYQSYEYGTRIPHCENLIKLCRYFNVSADYLLGLTDESPVALTAILEQIESLKAENAILSKKLNALKSVMIQDD